MNNLKDLNIEKELLPLFDFSLNSYARNEILKILNAPLDSIEKITERQNIFKGFTTNNDILKDYSYTVLYLNEIYLFLNSENSYDLPKQTLIYRLFASQSEKNRNISSFIQFILFFHRLQSRYFLRINLKNFPEVYQLNIKRILEFLANFNLNKYEQIIREKKISHKHTNEIAVKIKKLKNNGIIENFWKDFFEFEAYLSINFGIQNRNFIFPSFTVSRFKLTDFYHPLVKNPVKNSFETKNNVIVLNGPNMSGKSTLLKAVGICTYLGHLGIGIPATDAQMPFYNHFSVQINRTDDITNGYSHFMKEVKNLKNVVENSIIGNRCFAIFDELFSGTNVEDAFEICKTTINGLSKFKNSIYFISTHLQELQNVSGEQIENYFIDCQLIENNPTFTYQLKKGWSEIKVGRILFEKEGLNKMLQ